MCSPQVKCLMLENISKGNHVILSQIIIEKHCVCIYVLSSQQKYGRAETTNKHQCLAANLLDFRGNSLQFICRFHIVNLFKFGSPHSVCVCVCALLLRFKCIIHVEHMLVKSGHHTKLYLADNNIIESCCCFFFEGMTNVGFIRLLCVLFYDQLCVNLSWWPYRYTNVDKHTQFSRWKCHRIWHMSNHQNHSRIVYLL